MSDSGEAAAPSTVRQASISKLVDVNIRQVWPTEPHDFTPWLLANADHLSEVLGLEVQLDDREHKVGPFSLDLIGAVSGTEDQVVIVENQFGDTDHQHLGQILTYAGGTEPAVVIWIAERFREEHRAALDWLNHNTPPDIRFFGIQLAAVRMEGAPDHLVAPRLELVCKPNDWEKIAKLQAAASAAGAAAGLTNTNALYKRFWEKFAVLAKQRGWTNATPPAANWWSLPTGISTVSWGISFATFGCRSELFFGSSDPAVNLHRFDILEQRREAIQAAFGEDELIFDALPGSKGCRLEVRLDGPKIGNEPAWDDVIAWMIDTQERLRRAITQTGGIPNGLPSD